jgi:lipopolysaccharide/colanic/teichoic acid biosynthesis glycosyltransferase
MTAKPIPMQDTVPKLNPMSLRLSYDLQWRLLQALLLILDALVVWGSMTLAYDVRIASGFAEYYASYDPGVYRDFAIVAVPIWLLFFASVGLYRRDTLLGGVSEYERVVRASVLGILALITLSFFSLRALPLSRGWLLLAWAFACLLLCTERFTVRRLAYALRRRGWLMTRVLIVGANDQGSAIAEQWLHAPTSGMAVVGFADDFLPVGSSIVNGLHVLGRPSELDALARQTGSREIVVVASAVAWESFEEIILRAKQRHGFTVRLSPGFYELLATGVAVTNKTFVPLLTVNESRLVGMDAVLKRLLDYGLGLGLCVLLSPVIAAVALGLKWVNREDPVLDRYQTIGLGGVPFTMYKFHVRSPEMPAGPEIAAIARPQAPSGLERLLLRRELDKLPQLFNVLAGHMGMVGPRPRMADGEVDNGYAGHNLQSVKPGMIGPWTTPVDWRQADEAQGELFYVRNWTIWLDLQILFQTIWAWLRKERRPSVADADATGRYAPATQEQPRPI